MTTNNENLLNYKSDVNIAQEVRYSDHIQVGDIIDGNWKVVRVSDPNSSGYQGYALKKIDSLNNEIKIVHKETDQFKDMFDADVQIAQNRLPDAQIQDALTFRKQVSLQENIELTQITHNGYSLGGFLAKTIALIDGSTAVAQNSPIITNVLGAIDADYGIHEDYKDNPLDQGEIVNINLKNDAVSNHGGAEPLGITYTLDVGSMLSSTLDTIQSAMDELIGRAGSDPELFSKFTKINLLKSSQPKREWSYRLLPIFMQKIIACITDMNNRNGLQAHSC